MPKEKEMKNTRMYKRVTKKVDKMDSNKTDPDLSESFGSADEDIENVETPTSKITSKRSSAVLEDSDLGMSLNFGCEVSKLLKTFENDMNSTLVAKQNRLEQYTQETMRTTSKKIMETTKAHCAERKKLIAEFRRQMADFIQQTEFDLEKSKEAEEKFLKFLSQQQKHQQQIRIANTQRLKSLKNVGENFFMGLEELEGHHQKHYSNVNSELKKEMSQLQKKILTEIQQQEMLKVRKNLQSMLSL